MTDLAFQEEQAACPQRVGKLFELRFDRVKVKTQIINQQPAISGITLARRELVKDKVQRLHIADIDRGQLIAEFDPPNLQKTVIKKASCTSVKGGVPDRTMLAKQNASRRRACKRRLQQSG